MPHFPHISTDGSIQINLVSIHTCNSPQSIPLANAFLKSYAHNCAVSIELTDFVLSDNASSCAVRLSGTHSTAIGFSTYVWNRELCHEIASELRSRNPSLILFCGGPEVTADPESFLDLGIFNFVITGEGEIAFKSFCQALEKSEDYTAIPGIISKDTPTPPPLSPLTDLDLIPSPYLTGVLDTNLTPGILWQLSRGCCFSCDFCFDSRGVGGVRHFSLNRIEAELRHFAKTGVSQIFVLDSTFNQNRGRAKTILRMIRDIAPDIHFHFEVRCEYIDKAMADLFAQISCSLQIGLQSADHDVLKQVGRTFNKSDFTSKVNILNRSGAIFGFDLIYGLPGDSLEGFKQSLDYALSLYPNHLDIFPLAILPGTRLAANKAALNIRSNPRPPYLIEETDSFSRTDMTKASLLATACDIFYTRGKAVAWFNGVVAVLGMRPSAFFVNLSRYLINSYGSVKHESYFSDEEIWGLQQIFIKEQFKDRNIIKYVPLALDLARYHHFYASVLTHEYTEPAISPRFHTCLTEALFRLAPSARIAGFTYDIDELLQYGEPNIPRMFKQLSQSGSQAVMYRSGRFIHTESLDTPYIHLLKQISISGKLSDLSASKLTRDQITDFIQFALREGIIELL